MRNRFRTLVVAVALALPLGLVSTTAQAQDAQTCQPGFVQAYLGPHSTQYQSILNAMLPVFGTMGAQLNAMVDQASYENLLTTANTLAASLPTGRVVVTVPDGTVVLDSARDDNTMAANSNSYQHFLDKTINENHNSRVAISSAQQYPCGFAVESKLSTTTGKTESYLAIRVGIHLDSLGTIRMSVTQ